jgi:hypothetical protein
MQTASPRPEGVTSTRGGLIPGTRTTTAGLANQVSASTGRMVTAITVVAAERRRLDASFGGNERG